MTKETPEILIIDDEPLICWSLSRQLAAAGYPSQSAETGADGLLKLEEMNAQVVLLDFRLPDMDGLNVLREIRRRRPHVTVIMMTSHGSVEVAVEAMKEGAYEYLRKPLDFEKLEILIQRALQTNRIETENRELHERLRQNAGTETIIGRSRPIRRIQEMIRKVADSEAVTVLIQGESGTGKEMVARAIHFESRRNNKPFVPINSTALPENLLESELFGYEKGAFTDAKQTKQGQLEMADGGTVFLDEIGDMSLQMQVKILRFLETRSFKRLGSNRDIHINIRLIAATNRNLKEAMTAGLFREDLYYRLNVINIHIPPLREHPEDIEPLLEHFISRYNQEFGRHVRNIDPRARRLLLDYHWPGNVRELRNVVERILILEDVRTIRPEHLPTEINERCRDRLVPQFMLEMPPEGFPLAEMEKVMIHLALKRVNGNQTRAAELLSISRDTLRYKMKKHGLQTGS